MSEIGSEESFPAMLRRVLGVRLSPNAETFPDMFAVDGVLEYPYAPPGLSPLISGRNAIIANFQRLRQVIQIDHVSNVFEIEVNDPNLAVIEFSGHGRGVITDEVYDQRYISIIRLRDGHIVHYKDYWNPIAVLRAVKGHELMKSVTMD